MIKEIKLPEIAENIESATVLSILVSEGDKIKKDDNIVEMESDKATFDLPADVGGTVKEIKISEGDEVDVGQVVMTVETEEEEKEEKGEKEKGENEKGEKEEGEEKGEEEKGEKEKQEKEEEGEKKEKETKKREAEEEPEEEEKEEEEEEPEEKEEPEEEEEEEKKEKEKRKKEEKEEEEEAGKKKRAEEGEKKEVPAAPSVRRLARELGVEIRKVEGTGPNDRIMAEDVKSYAKAIVKKSGDKTAATDDYELPDFSSFGDTERKPLDSIRKRTAKNMTASWQSIPHVFQFDKADVTGLEEFREKYGKQVEKEGGKLTVTAIILKIMAKALEAFPKFNASLDMKNGEVVYKKYFNVGVAVDTERGLLVPVIRNVDRKSIIDLSLELQELAENARNKKIKPDQLQGANIAISNLGGIGGTNFTPIIYRPNVAILGVSRTTTEPVWADGEFWPRLILPLSLSYDHRLIDGAEAARFLRWFCEALENPLLTLFKGGK
ncbi:MAG: 2-oxo acid dehydrogenase subunit E2 [Bacteroidales bacterium]